MGMLACPNERGFLVSLNHQKQSRHYYLEEHFQAPTFDCSLKTCFWTVGK